MASNDDDANTVPHVSSLLSFIIGLAIIMLASILNAAGLNLTKLDHVRTSSMPKASRKKDWQRPLWLLGMVLYILSQLIGSTLALEYMRAEYVAPLGSSSLVFNFLFARFLVGTPVTSTDIYGTVVVIVGVIGIVAFGSINSGLTTETDVAHVTYLWRRGGWLGFFFAMSFAIIFSLIFVSTLDTVLVARSDISSIPFAGMRNASGAGSPTLEVGGRSSSGGTAGAFRKVTRTWNRLMIRVGEMLETWTAAKDDKTLAWSLGIGWACCGGALAGGTLVFAKATVKLISGSLSHENPGNQFGHAAPIFTIILLAITAVLQIICLNRGLKVYDSTLVVPVFYGVYTATGFLDSLVFNDEVDAYKPWTLFLIFISIGVLISGVVLLTHKKPDPSKAKPPSSPLVNAAPLGGSARRSSRKLKSGAAGDSDDEAEALRGPQDEDDDESDDEREREVVPADEERAGKDKSLHTVWSLGNDSQSDFEGEDEDVDHHQHPLNADLDGSRGVLGNGGIEGPEGRGLMERDHDEEDERRSRTSHDRDPFRDEAGEEDDEFGDWAPTPTAKQTRFTASATNLHSHHTAP